MTYVAHEETIGELTIKVEADEDAFNPRTEYDNLGTMLCWHSRYALGDKHSYSTPTDAYFDLFITHATEKEKWNYIKECCKSHPEDLTYLRDQNGEYLDGMIRDIRDSRIAGNDAPPVSEELITLPLYLYDHGGITMSTGSFGCPWDSGQVGFIYITVDKARQEFGYALVSHQMREEVAKKLDCEVQVYDQYLTGDVWGYIVEDEDGDELDSCWGFFGLDYCINEARAIAKSIAEGKNKETPAPA